VPVLFKLPKEIVEGLLDKGFALLALKRNCIACHSRDKHPVAHSRHHDECCWISNDTTKSSTRTASRANPGWRIRGPRTSIEAAHEIDNGILSIDPRGVDRMRSGPTATAALRTHG
jgi:hypothetical protein